MKIRKPWMIKVIGLVGAIFIRLWMSSVRPFIRFASAQLDPRLGVLPERYIYVFWHENILMPCAFFGGCHLKVLVSQHADGEMIAQVCRHLGIGTIRGSRTRGGVQAMRQMLRDKKGHIAVVPDGPRGPRRQVEMGVVYLAAKTGMPIVAAGIAYHRPWRFNTWDRFALPRPWSKACILVCDPIRIPADIGRDKMEEYRQLVQSTLDRVNDRAEKWANAQ